MILKVVNVFASHVNLCHFSLKKDLGVHSPHTKDAFKFVPTLVEIGLIVALEKKMMYFSHFTSLYLNSHFSPWNRAWFFYETNLHFHTRRMLYAMFG